MNLKIIDAQSSWRRIKNSVFQSRVQGPVPSSHECFDLGEVTSFL